MDTLIKVAQFFLSLSLLIVLHEWGHYFFARLFKTRVNKFYLFFDFLFPVPTLLNFALWKKKKGDTEFGIGWFPFGGYVQIDGMMDETQDADKLKAPPQPWEFRSKPAWQRLFIMMGGIIVNVITAFIIYGMILFVWGEKKVLNNSVVNGIALGDSLMYKIGFQDGDRIQTVNGDSVAYFAEVPMKVLLGGKNVEVVRKNGDKATLNIPTDVLGQLSTKKLNKRGMFDMAMEPVIDSVAKGSPAAGILAKGDRVVSINGTSVNYWHQLARLIVESKDSIVNVGYVHAADSAVIYKSIKTDKNKRLGISPVNSYDKMETMGLIKTVEKKYGFFESIPAGVRMTWETLGNYIDQFKLILNPETGAWKGMGGFASMTQAFGTEWDWFAFWRITAFFSIALAFMNFLPIPMLDGGYIFFTLVEMITGKKVPDRFLEKANMVGFFIIIALMVFTNGNDIFRKIMGWF